MGQQSPSYSQYTFNKFLLNPAAADMKGIRPSALLPGNNGGFEGTPKLMLFPLIPGFYAIATSPKTPLYLKATVEFRSAVWMGCQCIQ